MIRLLPLIIALLLLCPGSGRGAERVVLATLEWPPYTAENLPENGTSAAIVRDAFAAMGYELELRFYPWSRAVQEASMDPDVVGFFPEYPNAERETQFIVSDVFGKSPLGFAHRVNVAFSWNELADLRKYSLGTVAGYVNSDEFDRLVKQGELKVDTSNTDALNLRKVLAARIEAAVVDENVFDYLMKTDPLLQQRQDEMAMSSQLLKIHDMVVCFVRTEAGAEMARRFNEGLKRIGVDYGRGMAISSNAR
jgi:polar amino acid transport system substrate-binding protein